MLAYDGGVLVTDVVTTGTAAVDVRISNGRVTEIGRGLQPDELVIAGRGGTLLPGLHDHHCHLLATAAAVLSCQVMASPASRARHPVAKTALVASSAVPAAPANCRSGCM